jgi:hypothetical protein
MEQQLSEMAFKFLDRARHHLRRDRQADCRLAEIQRLVGDEKGAQQVEAILHPMIVPY